MGGALATLSICIPGSGVSLMAWGILNYDMECRSEAQRRCGIHAVHTGGDEDDKYEAEGENCLHEPGSARGQAGQEAIGAPFGGGKACQVRLHSMHESMLPCMRDACGTLPMLRSLP